MIIRTDYVALLFLTIAKKVGLIRQSDDDLELYEHKAKIS